jgi:hypothetical protein
MRRRGARAALAVLGSTLGSIICIIHASACKDDGTHVYIGQLYVEARHCLGTTSSVDVVSGDDPGNCDPICIHQNLHDGGHAIYVATMCPPYPGPDFDTTGTDPQCPLALAALKRSDICLTDGGSTAPVVESDAGDAGKD